VVVAVAAGVAVMPAAASGSVRAPASGTVSTVAGGVGGPAKGTKVAIGAPCGVTLAAGSVYTGAAGTVRRVSSTGQLTTPAGTGETGPLGDRGPAAKASLNGACGVAVDHSGNLVITDTGNQRVRVVAASTGTFYGQAMTARHIYTVAGTGTAGFSVDGGPATSAELNGPSGVAVDGAGNLVIADTQNQRVRVIAAHTGTFYGQAMTAGHIYTVAGSGTEGFSGDGGPAASAELAAPWGVAVDGAGNLVVADSNNHRVRVVAAGTGTFYGQAMTAGDIYTVAGSGPGFSGDGGPATQAKLSGPSGVAVDGAGNLVIADTYNHRIRVVAGGTGTFYGQAMTAGDIYTVAGTGHGGFSGDRRPATQAKLRLPGGVAVDGAGNLVIGDTQNQRVRVVAAGAGTFYGRAMTAGDIYTVAGTGGEFGGDGGLATHANLFSPRGVMVDSAGNLFLADTENMRVRVVAAHTGTLYGRAMTAGHIYTVAGTGRLGFSGDGGPGTHAAVNFPHALAVDGAGNLLIADSNNNRIRVVAASAGTFYSQAMTAGDIYTVAGTGGCAGGAAGDGGPATAAELCTAYGVAVDGAGNLVIGDTFIHRVRVVATSTGTFYGRAMTAGDIYTVAGTFSRGFSGDGGPATSAKLSDPYGVVVDGAGNLVIADTANKRIRVVAASTGTFYGQAMTAGDIDTVAGTGRGGFSGEGGPATQARLNFPSGVAVDGAGNLVIADTDNDRVRVVAASTGTFYGVAMTAGHIYTVAGTGHRGFSGDGRPATHAELNLPSAVAVDSAGNVFIADTGNDRIREVAG
jgi:hypothetical protein